MKVITSGDTHGNTSWKHFARSPEAFDLFVFIGDYLDSDDVSDEDELRNLREIIAFRKENPEKIVLLLGNHDLHYMYDGWEPCSRFRSSIYDEAREIFQSNENLFHVAFQQGPYLWTHAGVSQTWLNWFREKSPIEFDDATFHLSAAEILNEVNATGDRWMLHTVSHLRGGDDIAGGITWADQRETMHDFAEGFHQIVGYSRVAKPTTFRRGDDSSITYVDCLETREEFYEIEI